jgi:hypothetical protein
MDRRIAVSSALLMAVGGAVLWRAAPPPQPAPVAPMAPTEFRRVPPAAAAAPRHAPARDPLPTPRQDAHAAYRLAQEGRACSAALGLYRILGTQTEGFDKCAKYLNGEPLPDWRYWRERALAEGDLLARLGQQGQALADAVEDARDSSDPEVQFTLAWVLLRERNGHDPTQPLALMIRACTALGCAVEDPRYGMGCLDNGTCASGTTVLDQMEQMFGAGAMQAATAMIEEQRR